jgi:hypothetical protein
MVLREVCKGQIRKEGLQSVRCTAPVSGRIVRRARGLRRRLFNVGFEAGVTADRRTFGIADLARYPLFPPEFLDFVRRVFPGERDQGIVHTVVVTGRRPL